MSDLPPPAQPYRGAVIFHGALAALIVVVAALTGGDLTEALVVAAAYAVVATAWTWLRFRQRERRAAAPDAPDDAR